jgi:hypothetical protein
MSKELLVFVLAIAVAVGAALGAWHRPDTVESASVTGDRASVSSIESMVSSANPGAWIVVGNKLYLVKADYDFNNKRWTIKQLANAELGSSVP